MTAHVIFATPVTPVTPDGMFRRCYHGDASPRSPRKMFTICTESSEENSPRVPRVRNPELSRLEAESGLVNLTSQWPDSSDDTNDVTANGQSPGSTTETSSPTSPIKSETDDDVVLVTDKTTQTDDVICTPQPSCSSSSTTRGHDPISSSSTSSPPSSYDLKLNDVQPPRGRVTFDLPPMIQHEPEDELISAPAPGDSDASNAHAQKACADSEAPTLKVEYVGKVWDAYVDDFLVGCEHIDQAAIFDIATASCIACSSKFAMSQDEFDHLADVLTCLNRAYKDGVRINGRHFRTVLADGRRGLMARTEDRDGCSACRTRTLVIIALHKPRANARICNEELMNLGDFFWAKGL